MASWPGGRLFGGRRAHTTHLAGLWRLTQPVCRAAQRSPLISSGSSSRLPSNWGSLGGRLRVAIPTSSFTALQAPNTTARPRGPPGQAGSIFRHFATPLTLGAQRKTTTPGSRLSASGARPPCPVVRAAAAASRRGPERAPAERARHCAIAQSAEPVPASLQCGRAGGLANICIRPADGQPGRLIDSGRLSLQLAGRARPASWPAG